MSAAAPYHFGYTAYPARSRRLLRWPPAGGQKTFQLAVKKIGQTQQLFQAELDAAAFHIAQMGLTDAKRLRHILLAQLANRAQELDIGADFFQILLLFG